MTEDITEDQAADALFGVADARTHRPGNVVNTFRRLVDRARAEGKLLEEDAALIAGVEVLAEALDAARNVGGMKGGYLAAQAFPPFQRGLHALRLPVELTAVSQGPPVPGEGQSGTPDWLSEHFGTPE